MPSSLQRVPLQQPTLGLQADRPQRFVDAQGLTDSQNMMFIDGLFRTRPGFGEPFVMPNKSNPNTGGPVVSFLQYNYANVLAGNSEDRRFLAHTTGENTMNARVGTGLNDLSVWGDYTGPRATVSIAIASTGVPDTCTASVTRTEDDQTFMNLSMTEYAIPTAGSQPRGLCAGNELYGGFTYPSMWFTQANAARIGMFSTRTHTVTEFANPSGHPVGWGIALGADGNMWFTLGSVAASAIGRITPDGTITEFNTTTPDSYPSHICLGPDGNMWFTEYFNGSLAEDPKIGRITPAGVITEFSIARPGCSPRGIALGQDGCMWFTEQVGNRIGRITTAGDITEFVIPTTAAGPFGICLGPDGNMWFTEYAVSKIGRITPAGVITEFPIPSAPADCDYISPGPDGNVWASAGPGLIIKVTPSGMMTEYPILTPTGLPYGIALGNDGLMWFIENDGNKICRVSSTATAVEYSGACPTATTPIGDTGLFFVFGANTGHTNGNSWSYTMSGNGWRRLDKPTNSWIDLVESPLIKTQGFGGKLYGGCLSGDHLHIKVAIDTPALQLVGGSGAPATYGRFDGAAHTVTFTPGPHDFGNVGGSVVLKYTRTSGTTDPGLISGNSYSFTVTSATVLTCASITGAGSANLLGVLSSTTDTFKWSDDDGATWEEIHIPITTSMTALLSSGISVKFDSATLGAHVLTDYACQSFAAPLTGDRTSPTIFRTFVRDTPPNAYVLGTNGVDPPKVWDGTALVYRNMLSLTGTEAPPPAKCMVVSANRVILGGLPTGSGLGLGPSGLIISDDMDFDSQTTGWGGTSGTLVQLLDTPGDIVAMQEFGNLYFVVYKEDSIYLAMAQADTVPFRFELKKSGISGPCSSRAVVPLPNGSHAYLARDGSVFVFDGNSVEPIGGVNEWRKIQALVLRTLDTLHPEYAWGMFDNEQQMLYFFWKHKGDGAQVRAGVAIDIPTFSAWPIRTSNIDTAFGARVYLTFDTTIGELTDTIGSYSNKIGDWSTERPGLMFGGGDGQCYSQAGSSDNGTAIEAFWETGLNDFGDVITSKTVAETQHLFLTPQEGAGTTNVSVQIGYSDYGERRNLTDAQVVDASSLAELPGYGPRSLGHRVLARMISVRFSASCQRVLAWIGSTLSYVIRGQR